MKKGLCVICIAMTMIGCVNKEIVVNGKTVSQRENEQKKYEKDKNKKINVLDSRIQKFDVNSAKNLEGMGTTITVPK